MQTGRISAQKDPPQHLQAQPVTRPRHIQHVPLCNIVHTRRARAWRERSRGRGESPNALSFVASSRAVWNAFSLAVDSPSALRWPTASCAGAS